jgi:hypothetical protein
MGAKILKDFGFLSSEEASSVSLLRAISYPDAENNTDQRCIII